jgi:hypothetical protein
MKQFEYRENRGYCRLCETASYKKDIVFGCKLAGKSVQIILCDECIAHLKAHIDTVKMESNQ